MTYNPSMLERSYLFQIILLSIHLTQVLIMLIFSPLCWFDSNISGDAEGLHNMTINSKQDVKL